MSDIDFEEDAKEISANADLSQISELGRELVMAQKIVVDTEELLKNAKAQVQDLEFNRIPAVMNSLQLQDFTMEGGSKVSLKQVVKASLPTKTAIEKEKDEFKQSLLQKRLTDGLEWLRDDKVKGNSLIKNVVELEFSKGQDNIAGDFVGQAEEKGIPHQRKQSVHPATLSNFVKERLEKGLEVPKETLGLYCGQKATIKNSG